MLHFNTAEPETLKLLRDLQAYEECQLFSLAGGTALSLHLGHRISIAEKEGHNSLPDEETQQIRKGFSNI